MKNKHDPALVFSNPRLLAAVYYGLLSVVGTILINALLTSIGIEEIVPLFQAILLGMVVASVTGALFGKRIINCPKPYAKKVFLTGFTMVILSLPFFDLGLVLFMNASERQIMKITDFHDLVSAYLIVLGYSYLLFGVVLAIASGFASIYLRSKLVYQILKTDKIKSHALPQYIAAKKKSKARAAPKPDTMHHKKT